MPIQTTLLQPQEIVNQGVVRAAPLGVQFDSILLDPLINPAAIEYVIPALGENGRAFYEDLVAQRTDEEINYNAALGTVQIAFPTNTEYEALFVNSLYSLLSLSCLYLALPFIQEQIGSNSIIVPEFEYARNEGRSSGKHLKDRLLDLIDIYQKEMKRFLCENKDNYTLFESEECDGCEPVARSTKINGVIIYKNKKHRYNYGNGNANYNH